MIILFMVLCIFLTSNQLSAQINVTEYPFAILAGKEFKFSASNKDTLWVLTNSQYKKAIKIAKRQNIDSTKVNILVQKTELQQQIATEKDSLIATYKRGYIHYRDLWKETDLKLEEAEIKASKRWRFLQVGLLTGIVAGVFIKRD